MDDCVTTEKSMLVKYFSFRLKPFLRTPLKMVSIDRLLSSFFNGCEAGNLKPELTFFTKDNCQLCDEAMESLAPHLHLVTVRTVDIEEEGNEDWYDKYRYEIPVFFLNKKFLCKNKIDLQKFLTEVGRPHQT